MTLYSRQKALLWTDNEIS